MASAKTSKFLSGEETFDWLNDRMKKLNIASLEELAQKTGIDRGSLSRYFHQERRPSIDVVGILCQTLSVSPETLLIALGALPSRK